MGSVVQDAEVKDFNEFMQVFNMNEMRLIGRPFTWTNGHGISKLDRAVVNANWMQHYRYLEAIVMDTGCSKHSPILIIVEKDRQSRRRPFKFFNALAKYL